MSKPGEAVQDRGDCYTVLVPIDTVRRLRPFARQRDLPVARLIDQLLDVIATDKLTAAILDDDIRPPHRNRGRPSKDYHLRRNLLNGGDSATTASR